nr:MAG: major capsid protein [Microvirus sp.]
MSKSVMAHQFSQVPRTNIPRSSFNRSHGYKTTFDSGYLIPFYVDEALPGDTFSANATIFARMNTLIVPVMDNLYLDTFYFAVPNRLIWDNWQKFNGEQKNPGDTTDYLVPTMKAPAGGFEIGSIHDYMAIPTGVANLEVCSFWHRAYNLIYNEWFRDENLQDSVPVPTDDGPDDPTNFTLLRRGKRHDYFTSALPWPQKGPGVELPIGGSAPIVGSADVAVFGDGKSLGITEGSTNYGLSGTDTNALALLTSNYGKTLGSSGTGSLATLSEKKAYGVTTDSAKSGLTGTITDPLGLTADLSKSTPVTINALRQAFQIQKMYERDARGGTRYTEILRSHFGVISPDARLQRPEYLGGSSSRIHINPVMQTSASETGKTPQGNLSATGVVSNHSRFTKSFVEHCVIIGLVNVRADLTYQQGLDRKFSRKTRFDFYWPALAHLGEQAILNKEIYAQGTAADEQVFGYQERYAEYRYFPSKITGKFRSTYPQSMDVWHLSQKFTNLPTLSSQFIEDNPPINRVVAVTTEPQFIMDSYIQLKCARPMPVYGVPGLVDHF